MLSNTGFCPVFVRIADTPAVSTNRLLVDLFNIKTKKLMDAEFQMTSLMSALKYITYLPLNCFIHIIYVVANIYHPLNTVAMVLFWNPIPLGSVQVEDNSPIRHLINTAKDTFSRSVMELSANVEPRRDNWDKRYHQNYHTYFCNVHVLPSYSFLIWN